MWSSFWLAMFALAVGSTYLYIFRTQAVMVTSTIATTCWFLLSLTGSSIEVVTEGGTQTVTIGPAQYVMLAFGILSLIVMSLTVLGWYPDSEYDDIGDQVEHYRT